MKAKLTLMALALESFAACIAGAQTATETVLLNFGIFTGGATPYGTLIRDSAGNLYGTTSAGGTINSGTVFELSAAGKYTVLHSFLGGTADGSVPQAGVTLDSAGNLYGTTYAGGASGLGVVFEISATGQETILHSFTGGADGTGPYAGVAIDSAGNLYGTTRAGGNSGVGVVYKVTMSGEESILYAFTGGNDGGTPYGGVTLDASGNLYGTTSAGGSTNQGVVFKITPSGQESVLYAFVSTVCGDYPKSGVIFDSDGNLYGTSDSTIYKLTPAGVCTEVADIKYEKYGGYVSPATPAMDASGNLYATTEPPELAQRGKPTNGAALKISPAGEVTILYSFPGASEPDNQPPGPVGGLGYPGVVLDPSGNAYVDTPYGGVSGAIYKVSTTGKVTTLHSFTGAPGGTFPNDLRVASDGDMYGTTGSGGAANLGAIYRVDAAGHQTLLYSFEGGGEGAGPSGAPLAMDSAGNLYGTTVDGGASNEGTVFKLSPSGAYTVLHSFTGGSDGGAPISGVTMGSTGNLYGTTFAGGSGSLTGIQEGVVYEMTTAGDETVLYSFTGLADGGGPVAGVALDPEGNIYSTTMSGGLGVGVIYKVTPAGQESVLYSFPGGADGADPSAGLARDAAGDLYGTAQGGGASNYGVLYELSAAGDYMVLHSFTGGADGGLPSSGVALSASGEIYGTNGYGGAPPCTCGVVYEYSAASGFIVLFDFQGGSAGASSGPVIIGASGSLYGFAAVDGAEDGGLLYKLTP